MSSVTFNTDDDTLEADDYPNCDHYPVSELERALRYAIFQNTDEILSGYESTPKGSLESEDMPAVQDTINSWKKQNNRLLQNIDDLKHTASDEAVAEISPAVEEIGRKEDTLEDGIRNRLEQACQCINQSQTKLTVIETPGPTTTPSGVPSGEEPIMRPETLMDHTEYSDDYVSELVQLIEKDKLDVELKHNTEYICLVTQSDRNNQPNVFPFQTADGFLICSGPDKHDTSKTGTWSPMCYHECLSVMLMGGSRFKNYNLRGAKLIEITTIG